LTIRGKVKKIIEILEKKYPDAKTALHYETPFELLVATILSAQCTDKRVNMVTKELFKNYRTPKDFAEIEIEKLEELIRPTGFFRNKAKNIKKLSIELIEKYEGEVPLEMDKMVRLPGIGRKTANVVLTNVKKEPGIVVDTHVKRISNRLGLTKEQDPVKIEFDLQKKIPKDKWIVFSHVIIFHGRNTCKARKPKCESCEIKEYCDFYKGNGVF